MAALTLAERRKNNSKYQLNMAKNRTDISISLGHRGAHWNAIINAYRLRASRKKQTPAHGLRAAGMKRMASAK